MAVNAVALTRTILYYTLVALATLCFILAAAHIGTTMNDFDIYYEASAELLVASILTLGLVIPLHLIFHRSKAGHILASSVVEVCVLGALWLLFLGGAAALSAAVAGLSCYETAMCGLGSALQAFAWLTWFTLLALLVIVLVFMIRPITLGRTNAWRETFDPVWAREGSARGEKAPVQVATGAGPASGAPVVGTNAVQTCAGGLLDDKIDANY